MKIYREFKPMRWKYFIYSHLNDLSDYHMNHIGSEIGYEEYSPYTEILDINYFLR